MRLRGLDLASPQGLVDFDALPPWVSFLALKATEGTVFRDPTFLRNRAEAERRRIPWFPYLFCRPSQDPIAQVEMFWNDIGPTMPDARPALDFENGPTGWTPAQMVDWFLRASDAIEERFGGPPDIYTFEWFEKNEMEPAITSAVAARLARCPLWIADYRHGEVPPDGARPFVPRFWSDYTFWQTSGNGSSRVPGIGGAVDHDLFNGDDAAFRRFRGLPDAAPTDPEPFVAAYPDEPPPDPPTDG